MSPPPEEAASAQTLPPHVAADKLPSPSSTRPQSFGYDAGESSRTSSLLETPAPATDSTLADPTLPNRTSSSRRRRHADAPSAEPKRSQKARSTGGFLLQGAFGDTSSSPRRLASRTPQSQRHKSSPRPSERLSTSTAPDSDQRLSMDTPSKASGVLSPPSRSPQNLTVRKRQAAPVEAPTIQEPPQRPASQGLSIDTAQIVNMALDLSESRRLASRRAVSGAVPPTLSPIPDSGGPGGALKQHLQQQRRTSRNISPRPDLARSPRLSSGAGMSSPIHASFEASRDASFRYQFTPSTLARAQKAKEHLELMAQYRRVLDMVPPLKPSARVRPGSTTSQPASPYNLSKASTANSIDGPPQLGRPYNPLQYIRNRKVRARERKGVDGAAQGFGDVKKVTDWVDRVALHAATGQNALQDGPKLPSYPDADAQVLLQQQGSPSAAGMKQKRPRLDWVIEPADMLADIYWLEQDNHIQLIEDRHWNRIFPKTLGPPKPLAAQLERRSLDVQRPQPNHQQSTPDAKADVPADRRLIKSDTQTSQGSARDRARQKLHDLKGFHRHSSTHAHHDFLRRHKSSTSDLSDSGEDERVRQGPRRTYTMNSKDILEKQMLEMIAKEAREGSVGVPSSGPGSVSITTPERQRTLASRDESRKASLTDPSELDDRLAGGSRVPQPVGRASLEIPMPARRTSFDMDASVPNSPDAHPPRDSPFIPSIGAELSPPPTRSSSPSRNPFHKVKTRIFRDRSREREAGGSGDKWTGHDARTETKASATNGVDQPHASRRPSPDRGASRSPTRKPTELEIADTYKSHGRHKSTDAGVKGIFRGARIDNVIKGGVSRIGDLIWRKESEHENAPPTITQPSETEESGTDMSDTEPSRGRHRPKPSISRAASTSARGKNYLDIMPTFHSTSHDRTASPNPEGPHSSRPPSRSSRFDLLKPPRIDVQHASPSLSPPLLSQFPILEQVDTTPLSSSQVDPAATPHEARKRLNSALSLAPSFQSDRRPGSLSTSFDRRKWSVSEHNGGGVEQPAPVSRREVARLRALVLSSGIMALEISRRAHEPRPVFARVPGRSAGGYPGFWPAVAHLSPEAAALEATPVAQAQVYHAAAEALNRSVEESIRQWQASADEFANEATPAAQGRVEAVRRRIAVDLSAMTRAAADEADETSRDLEHGQRLKTKQVVDMIDKLLRRRRRRFRWMRRAVWLGVEWVLVGFMWYVWFVVVILRVFWTAGRGLWTGIRWLLWL
ncbi:hypothetical protein B0T11DRAFT_277346 [Plectosphaerella cucumerina]|uniref:Uncharacterized protein n=1 Tax=Plectosphaerella cucumerina TaxID=40658 RepID=A0A8K0X7G7_9PEZI|nr:hypothetical protein B0T11DRAFT_277346 [Plectosphaerella cucumerina]